MLHETCFALLRHTRLCNVLSSFPETSDMEQTYTLFRLRQPLFFRLDVYPQKLTADAYYSIW